MEAQSQHDVDVDALSDGGGDIDGDVHKIQREYDDQGKKHQYFFKKIRVCDFDC